MVQDARGLRQATVLFPPGTQAARLCPDHRQPVDTLSLRLTEATVGPGGPRQSGAAAVSTAAGEGATVPYDGLPAQDAWLGYPTDLAVAPDGGYVFVESGGVIWRVDAAGLLHRAAGQVSVFWYLFVVSASGLGLPRYSSVCP